MTEQLETLLDYLQSGEIELRILPQSAVLNVLPASGFAIFDDKVARLENHLGSICLWEPSDVQECVDIFEKLLAISVTGRPAERIVEQHLKETKRCGNI